MIKYLHFISEGAMKDCFSNLLILFLNTLFLTCVSRCDFVWCDFDRFRKRAHINNKYRIKIIICCCKYLIFVVFDALGNFLKCDVLTRNQSRNLLFYKVLFHYQGSPLLCVPFFHNKSSLRASTPVFHSLNESDLENRIYNRILLVLLDIR